MATEILTNKAGEQVTCLNRSEKEKVVACFEENKLRTQDLPPAIPQKEIGSWTDKWYVKTIVALAIAGGAFELGRNSK